MASGLARYPGPRGNREKGYQHETSAFQRAQRVGGWVGRPKLTHQEREWGIFTKCTKRNVQQTAAPQTSKWQPLTSAERKCFSFLSFHFTPLSQREA